MSIIGWLGVYYQYSLQQTLLLVKIFHQKLKNKDPSLKDLFLHQRYLFMRPFDPTNSFISFNKKLVAYLVQEQSASGDSKSMELQTHSPTPSQKLVFNNGYDNDELLIFQYQASRLNFEEYYINKRKPQKLDVGQTLTQEVRQFNSLFVSACGEVFSISQDSADFEENLLLFFRIHEKSRPILPDIKAFLLAKTLFNSEFSTNDVMLDLQDHDDLQHLPKRKRKVSSRDRYQRRSRAV